MEEKATDWPAPITGVDEKGNGNHQQTEQDDSRKEMDGQERPQGEKG